MLASKKVILILPSLELGGAERQAVLLGRFLSLECGAKVAVWGLESPGPVHDLCQEAGLDCALVPFRPTGNPVADLIRTIAFARTLRRARPDILLPYTLIPNLLVGLVWKATTARICVWNQRDEGFNLHQQIAYHRWAVGNVTGCIANSERGRARLVMDFHLSPDRVDIVRNGVMLTPPQNDRKWWRDKLAVRQDDIVACMVANLHKYKDHLTVVRGWRLVHDELFRDGITPKLILAGRYDGTETTILEEVAALGLKDHVRLSGKIDDVSGLLGAVDFGVFSSVSEGCPNGVLESMLSGLPVVASDIESVREITGSQGRGLLFQPGNPKDLADKIITLVRSGSEERRTLGARLKFHVKQMYSPEQLCSRTEEILCHYLSCTNPN